VVLQSNCDTTEESPSASKARLTTLPLSVFEAANTAPKAALYVLPHPLDHGQT
jgi:hypothetical protein